MFLDLSTIYVPPEEDARIREPESLATAVAERMESIITHGQLQPILVEKLPEPIEGKEWKLIDGQVRFVTLTTLMLRIDLGDVEVNTALAKHGIQYNKIEATTREEQDPIMSLMMEYAANEDRTDFTWKEKGRYVRRIHDMLVERNGKKWTAKQTAEYIKRSVGFVSQYLTLTEENNPLVAAPAVQEARTRQTAIKQLKIEEAKQQRIRQAEADAQRVKVLAEKDKLSDFEQAARLSTYSGDARDWIRTIPDEVLDWFHWDPPYGGREGEGGAFAAHMAVQTEHSYCLGLMETMFPEIWRTLRMGSWLAIWYTPTHYQWLRLALQGHRFEEDGVCSFCKKHLVKDYEYFTESYFCPSSPSPFWVNPYPNTWYKPTRVADGHEISRFLVKQTEPFLFAGKIPAGEKKPKLPILQISGRGNVYVNESVPSDARRHVNHKPPSLLSMILSTISVPGSLGGDAGAGSGSIIEAAYDSGRKIVSAEIVEEHWKNCYIVALAKLRALNYGPAHVAPWLV